MTVESWQLGAHRVALPIVQGGMGVGISLSSLASAVAAEGGVGTIAAVGLGWHEPDFNKSPHVAHRRALEEEIRRARTKSPDGIIAVNIMIALSNAEELMEAAAASGANVLFLGAGLPLVLPKTLLEYGTSVALVPIVSSGRAARLIRDAWQKKYGRTPDGFVVEGPLAGGHLGFKPDEVDAPKHNLEQLVADVLAVTRECSVPPPVIAAGGIFTAGDVQRFLALGASAVQLGTRFVATEECDASREFKNTYVESRKEDISIIRSPVGLPGRALRSAFLDTLDAGELPRAICRYRCLRSCDPATTPYCIAQALLAAKRGDFLAGFAFCGANAHRVTEIVSVRDLIAELVAEPAVAMQ